jgi:hypothetical protein
MQIRRLRREGNYGIIVQIVNVPVDVKDMVTCLPRNVSEDEAINVNIKKSLIHKSTYLTGFANKRHIKSWLCLSIAPGQHKMPLNVIYDRHAEELSFPHIYYGVARQFDISVNPKPYTIATSEIRRRDR